jgi:hypothetical protein
VVSPQVVCLSLTRTVWYYSRSHVREPILESDEAGVLVSSPPIQHFLNSIARCGRDAHIRVIMQKLYCIEVRQRILELKNSNMRSSS